MSRSVLGLDSSPRFSNKKMPRSSLLWHHFNRKEADRGECKYCKAVISIAAGSMGNLSRHLKNKHSAVLLERRDISRSVSPPSKRPVPESAVLQNISQVLRLTPSPSPVTSNISIIGSVSETNENMSLELNTPRSSTSPTTPPPEPLEIRSSLSEFVKIVKPLPSSESKSIDIQLLKMICKEYHTFNIVDDPGFKKFVALLCPSYRLPSKKTLTNSLLPQLYHELRENLKKKIDSTTSVALTTDRWTSLNDECFLAISAHYIDENTNLCSGLLGCLEFTNLYTAENLAYFLNKEASAWGIQNKIVAVVTDNDVNIIAAVKICKWLHIPCFVHKINLIVKSGMRSIECTVEKIKSLVQYFNKCSFAQIKLKEAQLQMGLTKLKLKKDVPTDWNSLFDMLVRVFHNKVPITSALTVLGNEEYKVTDEDWEIVKHSIKVLEIFYEYIKEVSDEKSVSLSKTAVLNRTLIALLQKYKKTEGLPQAVLSMCERLLITAEEKLLKNVSEIISEATFLDPRLKNKGFNVACMKYQQVYDGVVNKIQQEIHHEQKMKQNLSSSSSHEHGEQTLLAKTSINIWEEFDLEVAKSKKSIDPEVEMDKSSPESDKKTLPLKTSVNIWEDFDLEVGNNEQINDPKSMAILEIDKFLSEALLQRNSDPLSWWEQRKQVYPHLYPLALKRLCVPASSVSGERIFSKAGQALTQKRTYLGPSKLSQVVFINANC